MTEARHKLLEKANICVEDLLREQLRILQQRKEENYMLLTEAEEQFAEILTKQLAGEINKKKAEKEKQKKQKRRELPITQRIPKTVWIFIALATFAITITGARYLYETRGTQLAEEEMYICHTPGCPLVKKLHYDRLIYFQGIEQAKKHGYQPCPLCHKLSETQRNPIATNNAITDDINQ